jgi:predicted ATPase
MLDITPARRIIFTGMSGTGKTALLDELRLEGFQCFEEPGRKILEERLSKQGDDFAASFIELMLRQSLSDFEGATNGTAFYDRGLPDTVAYAIRFGVTPGACSAAAETHRYETSVFVAPPWPEIFEQDEFRRATYDEYTKFHELLLTTYERLGYSLFELPKKSIRDRVEYIHTHIGGGT